MKADVSIPAENPGSPVEERSFMNIPQSVSIIEDSFEGLDISSATNSKRTMRKGISNDLDNSEIFSERRKREFDREYLNERTVSPNTNKKGMGNPSSQEMLQTDSLLLFLFYSLFPHIIVSVLSLFIIMIHNRIGAFCFLPESLCHSCKENWFIRLYSAGRIFLSFQIFLFLVLYFSLYHTFGANINRLTLFYKIAFSGASAVYLLAHNDTLTDLKFLMIVCALLGFLFGAWGQRGNFKAIISKMWSPILAVALFIFLIFCLADFMASVKSKMGLQNGAALSIFSCFILALIMCILSVALQNIHADSDKGVLTADRRISRLLYLSKTILTIYYGILTGLIMQADLSAGVFILIVLLHAYLCVEFHTNYYCTKRIARSIVPRTFATRFKEERELSEDYKQVSFQRLEIFLVIVPRMIILLVLQTWFAIPLEKYPKIELLSNCKMGLNADGANGDLSMYRLILFLVVEGVVTSTIFFTLRFKNKDFIEFSTERWAIWRKVVAYLQLHFLFETCIFITKSMIA